MKSTSGTGSLIGSRLGDFKPMSVTEIVQSQQQRCKGCKGISECKQIPNGFIPVITEHYGTSSMGYQECRYGRAHREQLRIEKLFSQAGIPARYKSWKKEDYKVNAFNEKAVKLAKRAAESAEGAYIYGTNGTGKTLLVSLVAISKMNNGEQVLFISVPELMEELRNAIKTGEEVDKLELAKVTECLILDDLGSEKMTEWVGSQLFRILDYRLNHSLQTIITSNYSPMDISKRLAVNGDDIQGGRIASRIYGLCKGAKIDGEDGRMHG